jgi:hypothetical protein
VPKSFDENENTILELGLPGSACGPVVASQLVAAALQQYDELGKRSVG